MQYLKDDIKKVEQFIYSLTESGGDVAYGLDKSSGVFQYLHKFDISLSGGTDYVYHVQDQSLFFCHY